MHSLSLTEIRLLSFPDSEVLDFVLDAQGRYFAVRCDDGHLDTGDKGQLVHQVTLCIKDFRSFEIKEFADEKWTPVSNYSTDFALKDICEFNLGLTDVTLKGFSKVRGLWTEYVFTGGDQSAYFES